jgi:hypothetical protein
LDYRGALTINAPDDVNNSDLDDIYQPHNLSTRVDFPNIPDAITSCCSRLPKFPRGMQSWMRPGRIRTTGAEPMLAMPTQGRSNEALDPAVSGSSNIFSGLCGGFRSRYDCASRRILPGIEMIRCPLIFFKTAGS